MRHSYLLAALLVLPLGTARAVPGSTDTVHESSGALDRPNLDTTSAQESESKGIIPLNAEVLVSSQPITPTSTFPEKTPYEQAKDELLRALELWNAGHAEAASDTALEAYDDFLEVRRVPKVKRSEIRANAHQAASLYVEAGIAYIRQFAARGKYSPEVVAEARGRLEDLRDVAMNYPELNRMLNSAIQTIDSPPVEKPTKK
jgi:hypothetical protein